MFLADRQKSIMLTCQIVLAGLAAVHNRISECNRVSKVTEFGVEMTR